MAGCAKLTRRIFTVASGWNGKMKKTMMMPVMTVVRPVRSSE